MQDWSERNQARLERMQKDRRQLHRYPEEGWCEFLTTYHIVKVLEQTSADVIVGPRLYDLASILGRRQAKVLRARQRARVAGVADEFLQRCGRYSGCIAEWRMVKPGPTVAFRFDIDALCLEESHDATRRAVQENYVSCHRRECHACGHDAHAAVGLRLARWIQEHRRELSGTIRLIFQPAEEGTRGAYPMVQAGWLDDVDYFMASHIGCQAALGTYQFLTDGFMATSKINVDFVGEASHAGSDPEKGKNALLAAGAAMMMMAGISRHRAGETRISIGRLRGGDARNITPSHAHMELETRADTTRINAFLEKQVENMVQGAAQAYDVQATITCVGKAGAIVRCRPWLDRVEKIARSIPGVRCVREESRPQGSDDATHMMTRVIERGGQALYVIYGCETGGHHRATFDIEEEAMLFGLLLHTQVIERVLKV